MSDDVLLTVKTKICQRCGQYKTLDSFWKRGKSSKFFHGYCKECHSKPWNYDKITCPHCKNRIAFFGIDTHGNLVSKKSELLKKLKKEATQKVNKKKKEPVNDLKDIFE